MFDGRYYVVEVFGAQISWNHRVTGRGTVAFSILDRYTCHREVSTDYGRPLAPLVRRQRIYAECARLNALEAAL